MRMERRPSYSPSAPSASIRIFSEGESAELLLEYSFEEARRLGYQAVVIFGDPDNYVSRGFKSCSRYHVCAGDGSYPAAMLVLELIPGLLDGRKWVYQESPAYAFDPADAEPFDRQFEPLKKEYRPSQESFYHPQPPSSGQAVFLFN